MKLLRGTYGSDAVIRTTKGDQISVKLDGQTAVINLDTLVRGSYGLAGGGGGGGGWGGDGALGLAVQRRDNAYHWISQYQVDRCSRYQVDCDDTFSG